MLARTSTYVTFPNPQHNRVSQPSKVNSIPGESIRFIYVRKRPEQLQSPFILFSAGTRDSLPAVKRPESETDHLPSHITEITNE